MKQKYCPCCKSSHRFRRRKKKGTKLLFFAKLYTCTQCYTLYAWLKVINIPLCIKTGDSKKTQKLTS